MQLDRAGLKPAPSSRAQSGPSPWSLCSSQEAPDQDQSCMDRKAAQLSGTGGAATIYIFMWSSGQAHPSFSKDGPRGNKGQTPKFKGSQASQGSHIPKLEAATHPNTHSAHTNIHIHTCTCKHMCASKHTYSAFWAGLECWGLIP